MLLTDFEVPASQLCVSFISWWILNLRLPPSRVLFAVILIQPPTTYDAHHIPGQMRYVIRDMTYLAKFSETENIDSHEQDQAGKPTDLEFLSPVLRQYPKSNLVTEGVEHV